MAWVWVGVFGVVAVAAAAQAVSGFGFALIGTPLVAVLAGPKAAASYGSEGVLPPPAPANRVGAARILAEVAVLGGEPAVPCTRNPLQRG